MTVTVRAKRGRAEGGSPEARNRLRDVFDSLRCLRTGLDLVTY